VWLVEASSTLVETTTASAMKKTMAHHSLLLLRTGSETKVTTAMTGDDLDN
jgi:hypothetical protein